MVRLPRHLPVLTVSRLESTGQQQLFKQLLDALEAQPVRLSLARSDVSFRPGAHLVRTLAGTDLLIADKGEVDSSAHLDFFRKDTVQHGDGFLFGCADPAGIHACALEIKSWLDWCASATPVSGAILIGGKSSRMGRPKHLIEDESGTTWLARTVKTIDPFVTELVISGKGRVPEDLKNLTRIDDLISAQGPLAGIGALFKNRPYTSWLVAACDMPHLSETALNWLFDQRRRGCLGVTPKNPRTGRNEPLLSWYDYRCGPMFEDMIAAGILKISELCAHDLVLQPQIPDHLLDSWRNINVPEEI